MEIQRSAGCLLFLNVGQVFPLKKKMDVLSGTKRCHACHMTDTRQEAGWLFDRKVWPHPLVPPVYLPCALFLMRTAGIQRLQTPLIDQRHQNSNIWFPSERFEWHQMKKRRLEFESWGARNIPNTTHAHSLIMIERCQYWGIWIPKSVWHQWDQWRLVYLSNIWQSD